MYETHPITSKGVNSPAGICLGRGRKAAVAQEAHDIVGSMRDHRPYLYTPYL